MRILVRLTYSMPADYIQYRCDLGQFRWETKARCRWKVVNMLAFQQPHQQDG